MSLKSVRLTKLVCLMVLIGLLGWSSRANADPPRTIAIAIEGDIDHEKLRKEIAADLQATLVEPGDPKANGSVLTIDARNKQIVVRYLNKSSVERRIDLPSDRARAGRAAALLAANVARDEAGEVLAELKPPPEEDVEDERAIAIAESKQRQAEADSELRQLHLVLDPLTASSERGDQMLGGLYVATGATFAIAGSAYEARPHATRNERIVGGMLIGFGVSDIASGMYRLVWPESESLAKLRAELARAERDEAPATAVATVERKWAKLADERRDRRRMGAWFALVLGSASVAGAIAVPLLLPTDGEHGREVVLYSGVLGIAGSLMLGLSVHAFFNPTSEEVSFQVYDSMKKRGGVGGLAGSASSTSASTSAATAKSLKVGVAGTSGGAMVTAGLVF